MRTPKFRLQASGGARSSPARKAERQEEQSASSSVPEQGVCAGPYDPPSTPARRLPLTRQALPPQDLLYHIIQISKVSLRCQAKTTVAAVRQIIGCPGSGIHAEPHPGLGLSVVHEHSLVAFPGRHCMTIDTPVSVQHPHRLKPVKIVARAAHSLP